jgi:serine/threonine-protein kinase
MTQQPIPIETMAEGMRAPEPMRAAIRKGLAKSPDERFQSVKEFADAFLGQGSPSAGTGTAPLSTMPRQRTEVGAPLDVAAAFGSTPGITAPPANPAGAGSVGPVGGPAGYTPAGGNVAYPTPAGIPQAPQQSTEKGGSRSLLLILAGVVGVASLVAIAFALKGSGEKPVKFDDTANAIKADPMTVLSQAPLDTGPTTPNTPLNVLPPLAGGSSSGPAHVQPHPAGGPSTAPPPVSAAPSVAKPPPYDGIECQRARALRAQGRTRIAEQQSLICIAKGGNPN